MMSFHRAVRNGRHIHGRSWEEYAHVLPPSDRSSSRAMASERIEVLCSLSVRRSFSGVGWRNGRKPIPGTVVEVPRWQGIDPFDRMISNITACQCLVLRLSQLQEEGKLKDEQASLAKAFCTVKMREAVGYARELLGANGILPDYHVARFVADAEAIYSCEGTRETNSLIVGKAVSGYSAFV